MSLRDHITNGESFSVDHCDQYAAILGVSPSRGARSPALWNRVFESRKLEAKMVPLDVPENALTEVVAALRADERFIGGAVAVPYKTRIIEALDAIDERASVIGAVNVVFRDGKSLVGSNTDGAAGVAALREHYASPLAGKRALLIGAGGAGTAVSAYLAAELGAQGELTIANRSVQSAEVLAEKLACTNARALSLSEVTEALARTDILVNCSSVGMELWRTSARGAEYLRPFSPLGPIPPPAALEAKNTPEYLRLHSDAIVENHRVSLEALGHARNLFVYDIIYQPSRSVLLEMASWAGFATLNGESMNLRQAAMAFHKTATAVGIFSGELAEVERAMSCSPVIAKV